MLGWLLDALFPAKCIGCGIRGTALCDDCRNELPYLPRQVCFRCASRRGARGACQGCRRLSPSISTLRAPFAYEGAARNAVLTLKFRSGRYLVPLMGAFLREELNHRPLGFDMVVPVPLAPGRLRRRGFNQASLLAEQLTRDPNISVVTSALARQERPAQSTLRATERLTNLSGAFSVINAAAIRGRSVLVLDDVVTTGTTVSACADTLARAGARRISVLAFARDL